MAVDAVAREVTVLPSGKVLVVLPYTLTNRTQAGAIYGFVQAPIMFVWDTDKETYLEALQRNRNEISESIAELTVIMTLRYQNQPDDDLV